MIESSPKIFLAGFSLDGVTLQVPIYTHIRLVSRAMYETARRRSSNVSFCTYMKKWSCTSEKSVSVRKF
ncbi:unnamed protein product [Trichogramma brassicae]|uniref:Uncharacterized protein n=1 Tax=Trichogramma brassicae TaxID=86971 RepID=A0A6H5JC27_9HYME|nr:unnamed protein product [Trichogramma brassicae]